MHAIHRWTWRGAIAAIALLTPMISIAARDDGRPYPPLPWAQPDPPATPVSVASDGPHDLDRWHWSMPVPQGNTLQAVASNGVMNIAVGDRGTIVSGYDGAGWVSRRSPTRAYLRDVTWGHGRFVAVGWGGVIVTSTDGFAWTVQQLDPELRLSEIASDGDGFVVTVDDDGTIVTSDDGVAWTVRPSALGFDSTVDVIWTGDRFVALGILPGFDYDVSTFESPDGVQWTEHVVGTLFRPLGLAYNGATLLVVGHEFNDNQMHAYTSTDGEQWTSTALSIGDPNEVTAGAGTFIAVGYRNGIDPALVHRSTNGIDWTVHETRHQGEINGARWNGTQFVIVGEDGLIATSSDARDWTLQQRAHQTNLWNVRWLGDEFFAIGHLGPSMRSSNGVDWSPVDINPGDFGSFGDVARGQTALGERTVVVGYGGRVRVSSDRVHFEPAFLPFSANLYMNGVLWGGGQFVAVGDGGVVVTSPNGTDWTLRPTPSYITLRNIAYNGDLYVAAGCDFAGGVVMTSPDGITWTVVYATANGQFEGPRDVIWTGEAFVVPSASRIVVSRVGIDWDVLSGPMQWYAINRLAWDGTRLLSVGSSVWEGTGDGRTWTQRPDFPLHASDGIASDGKQFISTYSNTVLRTGDDLFADGYQ